MESLPKKFRMMSQKTEDKLKELRYEEIENDLTKNQVVWKLRKFNVSYEQYRHIFPKHHHLKADPEEFDRKFRILIISALAFCVFMNLLLKLAR